MKNLFLWMRPGVCQSSKRPEFWILVFLWLKVGVCASATYPKPCFETLSQLFFIAGHEPRWNHWICAPSLLFKKKKKKLLPSLKSLFSLLIKQQSIFPFQTSTEQEPPDPLGYSGCRQTLKPPWQTAKKLDLSPCPVTPCSICTLANQYLIR